MSGMLFARPADARGVIRLPGPVPLRAPFPARSRRPWVAGLLVLGLLAMLAALAVGGRHGRPATVPLPVRPAQVPHAAPPVVEQQTLLDLPPDTAREVNAAVPVVAAPLMPAAPFRFAGSPESRARAVDCLAAAAWYEAGDDAVGERAVMQVVLNRVRHPAFRAGVCGVVFQGSERTTGCQFTFTCDGALANRTPSALAWSRARVLATAALGGTVDADVGYATHYHADYVVPYWASANDKIAVVGRHIFYKWKGFWGTRGAFARGAGEPEPAIAALARLSPVHAVATPPVLPLPALDGDSVVLAPVAPSPVLSVEGVREKSLRGALVRGQLAGENQFFLQLDAATFPGNYATAAVALCKGRPTCLVLGWRDVGEMSRGLPLTREQRRSLSFYFAQDAAGGRALWNCGQSPRANPAQCLPGEGLVETAASGSPPAGRQAAVKIASRELPDAQ